MTAAAHRAAPRAAGRGRAHRGRGGGRGRREGGQASIEFLGFLPILLLIALAGVQLGLVAYVGTEAGVAARAAARTADPAAAGAAVSGWLHPRVALSQGAGTVTATVTVTVPSVLPGILDLDPVTRSATMPRE